MLDFKRRSGVLLLEELDKVRPLCKTQRPLRLKDSQKKISKPSI